jgi:hypothetical protein
VRISLALAAIAAMFSFAIVQQSAHAAINIADGKPIIGGSGDYANGPYNSGSFPTYAVTDGFGADGLFSSTGNNDTGPIWEFNGIGYWLGRVDAPYQTSGYFVLDLGAAYKIGQIALFNTHNGQYHDRGTGDFTITASNSIQDLGGSNFDLVSPTEIATGTLLPQTDGFYITPGVYTATSAGPYRYLRFDAESIGAHGVPHGLNGVGLNEIRVFEAVPEPGVLLVVALVGATGFAFRRKISSALKS